MRVLLGVTMMVELQVAVNGLPAIMRRVELAMANLVVMPLLALTTNGLPTSPSTPTPMMFAGSTSLRTYS